MVNDQLGGWGVGWGGGSEAAPVRPLVMNLSRGCKSKSFKVFNASEAAAVWIGIKEPVEQKAKA